jgi:uncharacterized protein DUF5372
VTHRFHPLFGWEFDFVVHRQNWGEDRVHLHDENGELLSLPAGWTDLTPVDPFVVVAEGRCPFTTTDLLALVDFDRQPPVPPLGRRGCHTDYAVSVTVITPGPDHSELVKCSQSAVLIAGLPAKC